MYGRRIVSQDFCMSEKHAYPLEAARPRRDVWLAARRGLALRCPACGKGRVLAGFLKPAAACWECGEDTGRIRADDGPAWATILLVGHLVSPAFFVFATRDQTPWTALAFISGLVLALTLLLLPRMKGLFIGVIWATGAGDASAQDNTAG
jgi:uncharacterized protein (DUF983 family)